ncbi:MAG TPA: choice-of-anchor D domain-containing protein [Candidatus Solibacter sp.]|nr:choice-of-anchor D domain-containing protein [Candidatus Solibacter sp.]
MRQRVFRAVSALSLFAACFSLVSAAQTATFSPTSLSFPSTVVGQSSSPLPITLTNTGTATLKITKAIVMTQPNAADFTVTNNCGTQVLAGGNCTINVTFVPTTTGARSANVQVTDNAPGSPQKIPVSGTGLAPAVTASVMSLTYGDQLIGSSSAPQTVTIKNSGTAPLNISSIVPWGANASDFSLTNTCGTSLAVNATCTINATFTPSAAWSRTAAIQIVDNALSSPQVYGLAGNGTSGGVASFSPSSLTFTTRLMFTNSPSQPITLNNTGTAPLQIATITTSGDYSQTNNCGTSVAAGGSCTINVTFTPYYNATRPGFVYVDFTDPAGIQSVALTGAGATPAPITVKPRIASLTQAQTQQYTAFLSNVVTTAVTWSVDGVTGGNSTVGTISTTGLYTPPATAGSHLVRAVNNANKNQGASVPVVVSGYTGTATHHNDTLRTGQNNNETALTSGNVNHVQFGKLFKQPVDGQMYSEPLWVPDVNVGGVLHNVVIAATQHDSVYAFDADTLQAPLWHTSFINPSIGVTTIPQADVERGLDISPEIGITSTPVVDPVNGIVYVEARTKDTRGTANCPGPNNAGSPYFHFLHALNLSTGAEMAGSPVMICAQVPGNGYDNYSGVVYFNEMRQNNRAGLLLLNGTVYIAFASLEDISPYHGWVLGYKYTGSGFTQSNVWCYTCADQSGNKAGIWHGGGGIPADASGNLYVDTGTGSFNNTMGGGISFAKLTPSGSTLNVADYFAPFNQTYLTIEMINLDLSSAGPMLLPDQPGPNTHLAVLTGKTGTVYLINRDNMGKYSATSDNVVQSLYTAIGGLVTPTGNWGTPAYFNENIYIQGVKDLLKQFTISNGLLSGGPTAVAVDNIGYPGTTPAISSNGTLNGIVWVVQSDGAASSKASTLRAYDAGNIANELYNSGQNGTTDVAGPAVKFAVPTVANGKVYVPTASELDVYGLKP